MTHQAEKTLSFLTSFRQGLQDLTRSGINPARGGCASSRPDNTNVTRPNTREQPLGTTKKLWAVVLIICIGSRLLSTIYYIEDLDSLRFALSMVDYDVAKLQPHFPAYPVFCCIAKLLYAITGRYAVAFSLIGGLSTFFTCYWTLKIAAIRVKTPVGIATVFVICMNPLLWLMSNRYMPDAMGVACMLASLYFVAISRQPYIGFFLTGILLGVRLSYLPILLPALLMRLWRAGGIKGIASGRALLLIAAAAGGTGAWLIPLIGITGWDALVAAARTQSYGHFSDFGGTIATHPSAWMRVTKLFESVWADGFGLYWQGRHLITGCATIALCGIIAANWGSGSRQAREFPLTRAFKHPIFAGCVLYVAWIFFGQNVIHKSRHVLPMLPFLGLGIAIVCSRIVTQERKTGFPPQLACGCLIVFSLCYSYVTLTLVVQHTKPTAIAQVQQYLRAQQNEKLHIVSVPLIKYYLASQAVEAVYIPIKSEADLEQLNALETEFVVIGSPLPNRLPKTEKRFYHNPYVNRMWSEIPLFVY